MIESLDSIAYYEITPAAREAKGERYFKVTENSMEVTQVVASVGERPKNPHKIGIYLMARNSFATNYLIYNNYVHLCTKEKYEEAFAQVADELR